VTDFKNARWKHEINKIYKFDSCILCYLWFHVLVTARPECSGLIVWRCDSHRWFVAGIIRTARQLWHKNIHSICTKNFAAERLGFFFILEIPGLNFESQTDSYDNVSAILHSTSRLKLWKFIKKISHDTFLPQACQSHHQNLPSSQSHCKIRTPDHFFSIFHSFPAQRNVCAPHQ